MDKQFSDFATYLEQFAPGAIVNMQGAAEIDILELETLSGKRLPRVYADYLLHMGHSTRMLSLFEDANCQIDAIKDYYRNVVRQGIVPDPEELLLIAVSGLTFAEAALDISDQGFRVFATIDSKVQALFADSFLGLLFRTAFVRYRPNQLVHSAIYNGPSRQVLPLIDSAARARQFSRKWFSDSVSLCLDREEACIVAEQFDNRRCWLRVSSDSAITLDDLGRMLENECGMSFGRSFTPSSRIT